MRLWPRRGKYPIDEPRRQWVDARMRWLADQFGSETLRRVPAVEPTDAFFPDRYEKNEQSARQTFARVCGFIGVEPGRVDLRFYAGDRRPRDEEIAHVQTTGKSAAGFYTPGESGDRQMVAIDSGSLQDPQKLIATMAHELAHVRLLGEGRISREEEDHEPLTDLTTVFFGLGIFTANSTFHYSQWHRGGWHGWKASTLGYMTEPSFGYALGLWSQLRGEEKPAWMRHLRLNPRTYMKQTIRRLNAERTDAGR